MSDTRSTFEFFQKFPDEEASRQYFETCRWNGESVCGHCGSTRVAECKDHKPMPYRCKDCRKHFSVRTGTVLAESRLPLQTWLLATYMLTSARKGIPSTQMARELGITQKSAWILAQRIRETWLKGQDNSDNGDHWQADETYVGSKEKNQHAEDKSRAGRGAVGKFFKDQGHAKGVDSFRSLLKRGSYGIYHYMSPKHSNRYVNKFSFCHNTANSGTMQFADITINSMAHKCLTHKDLING